jgi:hypothetical protein
MVPAHRNELTSANATNATLYEKLSFNFMRDIAPIAATTRAPLVLEVHPTFQHRAAITDGTRGQWRYLRRRWRAARFSICRFQQDLGEPLGRIDHHVVAAGHFVGTPRRIRLRGRKRAFKSRIGVASGTNVDLSRDAIMGAG